jgi:Tfp pilus assembly protein PilN
MRAVNLLPREQKRSRKRLTVVAQLAVVAPFVVGSLLAAGYLLTSSKVNDNKSTLQALQDDVAKLPAPTPTPEPQPDLQLALQRDQRIAALGLALKGRLAWDRVLREISAVLPNDVWLTSLSAQSPLAPAATTPTTTTSSSATDAAEPLATGPLSLNGYTYSQEGVARFLSRLAVVPALQDVKLLQSAQAEVAGQKVVSFSMQAGVRPGVTG